MILPIAANSSLLPLAIRYTQAQAKKTFFSTLGYPADKPFNLAPVCLNNYTRLWEISLWGVFKMCLHYKKTNIGHLQIKTARILVNAKPDFNM
jgi:hypothetical protein